MKVYILLVCLWLLCWRTEAQSQTYLITAPIAFRLDASETVLLQLFGFTDQITVHVFLKTSMARDHKVLARDVVTLNTKNHHQAIARVRLFPHQLDKNLHQVVLHVQSPEINHHLEVPVTRSNGFLFIQTDKPLYTPHQSVKVRAFSLNQEMMPANRSVFLTFKDPFQSKVDTVEMIDVNNGIPSMQNHFKIPIKPKLGIWSIDATYSDDFTTKATTEFEVKEYVLPSLSIMVEPEANFISYGSFTSFTFKVSAKYLHGAPVADGEVFLRYGHVSGKSPPVIIPNSVTRERLSSSGEVQVTVNVENIFSKYSGPKTLDSLAGKYLYIAVLLEERTGGISQESEFAAVKFVKSPYTLSLVSTPPFIKPGLPYTIQVLVRDHLEKPVNRVPIRLVERQLVREGRNNEDMPCPESSTSQSDGLAVFLCNPPAGSVRTVLMFDTADPSLPAASQASLRLQASSYHSPNQRYLYIDTPLPGNGLQAGRYANIKVYSATPSTLPIRALSYMVLSRGTVVDFGSEKFVRSADNKHNLNFMVTSSMVPSIRLVVYYILYGEGTAELVADSVWLDVRDKCVSGLKTEISLSKQNHKPKEKMQLTIKANEDGLVALTAVDSALYMLTPNYKDPVTMVLRGIEKSDQGCGGGGGKDSADVLRLAGLTFITNANAQPQSSSEVCTAAVRSKRAPTTEEKNKKMSEYGPAKSCCELGMRYSPKSITCSQFALQKFQKNPVCRQAFKECCEWIQEQISLVQDQDLYLGRHEMGANFDLAPSLVRSYFPESWMWEVQPIRRGQTSFSRTLPDSLTTWDLRAVGVFDNGVCVADSAQVVVNLPLSVNVPLPYEVVRGEQVKLRGSVYNQESNTVKFCVTLTVGPDICLPQSHLAADGSGLHSTACTWSYLPGGGVSEVTFIIMGLQHGEHTLTFTLKTTDGTRDILEKTLRVVPEGVRQEVNSGGMLDPQAIYGTEIRDVRLNNDLPAYMVPHTPVERQLTIHGEILGEVVDLILKPEGVKQLVNFPAGSAQSELERLLPLILVYQYLETTSSWEILQGGTIKENSAKLRQKIREGLVGLTSFRRGDSSYSMWQKRESSTWLTSLVVWTMAEADQVMTVDHQTLFDSMNWLIRNSQNPDGSFVERSSFSPNRVMAGGADTVARSVYLTSFVLIALKAATSIDDKILQLRPHETSMSSAAEYISQHAPGLKSVYVRAVAAYALTLKNPSSMTASQLFSSLEKLARQKVIHGRPVLRYLQESSVEADWLKPDQSSGETVEMTAYFLLTALRKGNMEYANPIVAWLSQDKYYGEGFYSNQDTMMALKALTTYLQFVPRATLQQDINIRFGKLGDLQRVTLSQRHPIAPPIQVTTDEEVSIFTGFGKGVSNVKLKTVYYRTTASTQTSCNFELSIDVFGPDSPSRPGMRSPHLVACVKYKPPPNEIYTESTLTLMKIRLPTGLEPYLEDLRQFTDGDQPMISHYELQENTLIIHIDSVPSENSLCVGFRTRTSFQVDGVSQALFTVSELQDKGSLCTKHFSNQEQNLQRLCVAEQCQCMTGVCGSYRGTVDGTLTSIKRTNETCRPEIRYAVKAKVTSTVAEGDFMTYKATIVEVLKNTDKALDAVRPGTEVELIKKTTCSQVELQNEKTYLLLGARGSKVNAEPQTRYRLPLDSDALVELIPTQCISPECRDYMSQLEDFTINLQLEDCP